MKLNMMTKKTFKTGILIILLVIPVFLFIFLQMFGNNHYTLPVYYASDSTKVNGKWEITQAHTIPDFELIDQNGKPFHKKDLAGKIWVAEFFFTTCGSICPVMSTELKRLQAQIADKSEVLILSHTIDPEHDTPKVLKEYAKKYKAKEGQWYFLTGNRKDIYDLAFQAYKVSALDVSATITPDFAHTAKLILVDKKGRIRGYYTGTEPEEVDRLATEIDVLLSE